MAWINSAGMLDTCKRVISKSKYKQVIADQWIPTSFLDGVPNGFRREVVRFTTEETVEEWVGVEEALAQRLVENGTLSTLDSLGRGTFIQWTARRANEANGWTVTKISKTITQEIGTS